MYSFFSFFLNLFIFSFFLFLSLFLNELFFHSFTHFDFVQILGPFIFSFFSKLIYLFVLSFMFPELIDLFVLNFYFTLLKQFYFIFWGISFQVSHFLSNVYILRVFSVTKYKICTPRKHPNL